MSTFDSRLGRLRVLWPTEPEPVADLTRLTPDELIELESILVNVRPGDLSRLSDDELDRLAALQRVAWGH